MKDRETLMSILAAGEVNGVLDEVAPELILEVLIDIRDLLEALDSRVDDLQSR